MNPSVEQESRNKNENYANENAKELMCVVRLDWIELEINIRVNINEITVNGKGVGLLTKWMKIIGEDT